MSISSKLRMEGKDYDAPGYYEAGSVPTFRHDSRNIQVGLDRWASHGASSRRLAGTSLRQGFG